MPRYIFPAGASGTPGVQPVTAWRTASGRDRYTDLYAVSGGATTTPIPNGVLVTDALGNYPAFAGPDDVASLYVEAGGARTLVSWSGVDANSGQGTATLAIAGQSPAQEPIGDAWAGTVGSAVTAARSDHAHPFSSPGDVRYPAGGPLATMPRYVAFSSNAINGGSLTLCFLTAQFGGTFTACRAYTGLSAASGISAAQFAVYSVDTSGNLALLGSTPNDTALFAATSTGYSKTLSSPVGVASGQRIALGLAVAGGTPPTILGVSTGNFSPVRSEIIGGVVPADRLWGSWSSAYSGSLPSSIAAASVLSFGASAQIPYIELRP